jgi:truncated hemoglobin YjbI
VRSLYDLIGGGPTIRVVVDELYTTLTTDPLVRHHFAPERMESLKAGQRRWFTSVLGGPPDGPVPDLAAAHASLVITDEQIAAVIRHLAEALDHAGVAEEPRDRVLAIAERLWYARLF